MGVYFIMEDHRAAAFEEDDAYYVEDYIDDDHNGLEIDEIPVEQPWMYFEENRKTKQKCLMGTMKAVSEYFERLSLEMLTDSIICSCGDFW
ncbi:hypothetical protein L6452_32578 [Arctium lappa]|uniref:Uncharacterized protein n=1 Tax=Arctium lappa TaxID=4217 RepID=A0ACB8Z5V4_ARCLA|nr:hypothetical protein L6452_32578 [Arctium lappa]